jgi:hypothetical protein
MEFGGREEDKNYESEYNRLKTACCFIVLGIFLKISNSTLIAP